MKIFDFLRNHNFAYDDITTDNFTFDKLPKNAINYNEPKVKEVLSGCYFLSEEEFLNRLVTFMNERTKTQKLSFSLQNDGENKLLCGSDGNCVDLNDLRLLPYIANGIISDHSYYLYLENEIMDTWAFKSLNGNVNQTRKYLISHKIENNRAKIARALYDATLERIKDVYHNEYMRSMHLIHELKVDMSEPFPRLLPSPVYRALAKEANDLFVLNNVALDLLSIAFEKPLAQIIHNHVGEVNETYTNKTRHYMKMEPENLAESIAIDTELMLLKLEHTRNIATLLISMPVLEESMDFEA